MSLRGDMVNGDYWYPLQERSLRGGFLVETTDWVSFFVMLSHIQQHHRDKASTSNIKGMNYEKLVLLPAQVRSIMRSC